MTILDLIKVNKLPILSSLFLAGTYILLILFYTHGGLLYGGDFVGYYSIAHALNQISPEGYLYAFSIFSGFGNYYIGFYVAQFLGSFINLLAIYYLAIEIFDRYIDKVLLPIFGVLASCLYLFNPTILLETFLNLISNMFISHAAFIVFLIGVIRFIKTDNTFKANIKNIFLMGIGLGLSLTLFPNYIRYILIGTFIFLFFALYKIILDWKKVKMNLLQIIYIFVSFELITLIFGLYLIWPLIIGFSSNLQLASFASQGSVFVRLYYGTFNTVLQSFRLLDKWTFLTPRVVYDSIYFSNSIVIFSSLFWPILALCIPLLFIDKRNYKTLLSLETLVLVFIFWSKGANAPLGQIYLLIIKYIPFGIELLPPYLLTTLTLSVLYPILISYSIVSLVSYIKRSRLKLNFIINLNLICVLIIFLLLSFLLITVFPVFTGQIYGQYYNQSIKGYSVPNNYQIIKNYLLNNNGSAVVFPSTGSYINTTWGYYGQTFFYKAFFYPVKIYIQGTINGTYSAYIPSSVSIYRNLTNPVKPSKQTVLSTSYKISSPYNNVSLNNNNLTLYKSNSSKYRVNFILNKNINAERFEYITISFRTANLSYLQDTINNGTFILGLAFNRNITYYQPNLECQSCFITYSNNGLVNISIITNLSDKVFYNITDLIFQINNVSSSTNLRISLPIVYGDENFSINPVWLNATKQYNISYIILDNYLTYGKLQSSGYVSNEVRYLVNNSYIRPVYNSSNLSLYKIN